MTERDCPYCPYPWVLHGSVGSEAQCPTADDLSEEDLAEQGAPDG